MGDQLTEAARTGDQDGVRACLEAGVHPAARIRGGWTALHLAASRGQTQCLSVLLEAGADVSAALNHCASTPLHLAAMHGRLECARLLLAAGADFAARDAGKRTALHSAVFGRVDVIRLLLQAEPAAALARDAEGRTPLDLALQNVGIYSARCLLEEAPVLPAGAVLAALCKARPWAQPLHGILAIRRPMTADQWAQVPAPCPGLGPALPTVLGRSVKEAGLLVGHMRQAEQQRLRTAALCLARAQRRACAELPTPIAWCILAQSAA